METQTIFGSVIGNKLIHDDIEEVVTYNKFQKDILNDYIQIRRQRGKIYIVNYFSS